MPEFYLRHTFHTRIVANNAVHAGQAALDIKQELLELLEAIGVEVIDADMQKTWELTAQQSLQSAFHRAKNDL